MRQKQRKFTKNIGVCVVHLKLLPLAQLHIIWKWGHPSHLNQPPKFLVGVKKSEKLFFRLFSKSKTEECNQGDWRVSDTFGIITLCSAAYHLELGAHVSLKAVKKVSCGGKKF